MFQPLPEDSRIMLKTLKLLTCQGYDGLAGGGGFLPVLSPGKKTLALSRRIYNIAVGIWVWMLLG
ncbi:hypothetical protein [Umezakia ovalisporum]|uniref:hypothetical protein n=1 Tax=Umezakia ovalisporum TaxID=75695 RepID=UPI0035BBD971